MREKKEYEILDIKKEKRSTKAKMIASAAAATILTGVIGYLNIKAFGIAKEINHPMSNLTVLFSLLPFDLFTAFLDYCFIGESLVQADKLKKIKNREKKLELTK